MGIKIVHEENPNRYKSGRDSLTTIEVNAFIDWVMYHIDFNDRQRLAAHLPGVYAKLTGVQVVVSVGKEPSDA